MKTIICTSLCIGTFLFSWAQDCKSYYYMSNDAEIEMTMFDYKGNQNGKQVWKIDQVKNDANGYSANVKTKFTDKKGKEGPKSEGVYKCKGGILQADIKMSMPSEQMEAYKDMDVKSDQVYIEYPAVITIGQALADADFKMEAYNKGSLAMKIKFNEANRKVEGKESITTPAGTWDAFKISYNSQFKAEIGTTGMGIPFNFKVTEWFVPGFGVVKTETYNKNGKLLGSTQLTSIKK